jgi:hypothetical protein
MLQLNCSNKLKERVMKKGPVKGKRGMGATKHPATSAGGGASIAPAKKKCAQVMDYAAKQGNMPKEKK